jgi:hypothetical protein
MRTPRPSRTSALLCAALLSLAAGAQAQAPKTAAKPAAHTGDLSGVWYPSSVNTFALIWTDAQGKRLDALPFTPWGAERFKSNHPIGDQYTELTSNDPKFACLPPGIPNIYTHAYPVEFIQVPGRTIMFFEYNHFVRQIFTDGRKHPEDANPTWMGDSIGKWEGDTLVVDSTGFNDKTWLDVQGHPHSEAMHMVERMSRPDHNTLTIDIAIDDPQAYTGTLRSQRKYILKPDWNIAEYICEDTQFSFDTFEKKVGTKGAAAQGAQESGAPAAAGTSAITGDWKGTIHLADGRESPATASFSATSTGTLSASDPVPPIKYEFQKISFADGGTFTAITADGVNLVGKVSADGKQMTGDVILPSGTGHKISLSRQ